MRIEDLEVGDIVLDNKHSGIFVGIKDGKPCIVHALSGGYHGANVRCTSLETFYKACNDGSIAVFRCQKTALAQKAAEYGYKFGLNKDLPFDDFRLILANNFSDKINREEQNSKGKCLDLMHNTFRISGLFRAIKFASRRDINLLKPDADKPSKKGLRCAFFVVLCFQIAALENVVEPLAKEAKQWVSNKNIDKAQLFAFYQTNVHAISQSYLNYISKPKLDIIDGRLIQSEELKSKAPDNTKNPNSRLKRVVPVISSEKPVYQPSILQWRSKEPLDDPSSFVKLIETMTLAMTVDAKYCTARELFSLLEEDKQCWRPVGFLNNEAIKENCPIPLPLLIS